MPVSASGERAVRSSKAMRSSSSQSSSSGTKVTRPSSAAWSAARFLPMAARAADTGAASSAKRVARRERPLFMGKRPKLASDRAIFGARATSSSICSMKLRSAASASSKNRPPKQEPSSSTANIEREETSSRRRQRRSMPIVSRTNQLSLNFCRVASASSTAARSPRVLICQRPTSRSLVRSMRMASSSSRAMASGHQRAPCVRISSSSSGWRPIGADTVSVAMRVSRSMATSTWV